MEKDYFDEYRKCIRKKYELEKNGIHAKFLFKPTEAKLRDLCIMLFREQEKKDDLQSFKLYFGFEFSINQTSELNKKEPMNKFKTIGKFFINGESFLQDINGLDLAAMLVGFDIRPFNKFSRFSLKEIENFYNSLESQKQEKEDDENEPIEPILVIPEKPEEPEEPKPQIVPPNPSWFQKYNVSILIGTIILLTAIIGINYFTTEKECMAWIKDHYEEIDCNAITENKEIVIESKKEDYLKYFKKIIPCDTTQYEKNGKACLWYGKSANGNEYEFFTFHGLHPETRKTLKEVTANIMDNYGKGPCQ
ncbi:hypothetical protein GOQ30_05675 [Flavobacterium sp. TP390]|uniref:Uncharacterized protein n=1 Tax=Flavobacterium profundi TaxID=1774945 RepID=A0A6I4IKS4_9FLAO|nr:hypothetical protein [Flavobacterium profundi]MVO08652.1 hypothetical protein [Flavobacterium profundi]